MYLLHHIKGNTYYIEGATNLGLYKLNARDVVLIDVPIKSAGEEIYNLLIENNFNLKYIVNTHSHPDHTGCDQYLAERTGCQIIASRIERAFMRNSKLDVGFLSGGYPLDNYDTPLMHIDEQHDIRSFLHLPDGLRSFKLPGHHYAMRGIKTSDGVYFIADSICTKKLLDKEHIMLIYDVCGYKKSLNYIKSLRGHIMVPSHVPMSKDLNELADYNLAKIEEIEGVILSLLENRDLGYDEILKGVFDHYNIRISFNKYLLMGSTIRSYISYLAHHKEISPYFKDNMMCFKRIKTLNN